MFYYCVSVAQCVAACCSAFQCVSSESNENMMTDALCIVVLACCSALQRVAVRCSALQCVSSEYVENMMTDACFQKSQLYSISVESILQ